MARNSSPTATLSPSLKVAIYSLASIGLYGTWGRSALNGTLRQLLTAIHVDDALPGCPEPFKSTITAIYCPVDYLLHILIGFFWQAVDGSHPTTSTFGLYFAAQLVAVITTVYVDSYKAHRRAWMSNATIWLLVFQLTAIATSGPWLVAWTLLAPALQRTQSPRTTTLNTTAIATLPISILLTYVALAVLMSLPSSSIVSNSFQQLAIAAWNVFPLFTLAAQTCLGALAAIIGGKSRISSDRGFAIRNTYAFAFLLCFASHAGLITLSTCTVLFPVIFTPQYALALRPGALFRLPLPWDEVESMGEGTLDFMQWDFVVGFVAMLLLAGVQYRRARKAARKEDVEWTLLAAIVAATLVLGPGSTLVGLKWAEEQLESEEKGK